MPEFHAPSQSPPLMEFCLLFRIVVTTDGVTPASGASVTVDLVPNRGSTIVQALTGGRFTLRGVPLGDVAVNVRDNLTAGVARRGPLTLAQDVVDFGTVVLDDTPVAVVAVDPPDGADGVEPGQVVRVTFSDPLQSAAGVQVRSGTQVLPAAASLSLDGLTLPGPTRLVAGDDDAYCPEGVQAVYGDPLGLTAEVLPGAAHLDLDAGYGSWPAVLEWCLDGTAKLTARPA